MIVNRSLMQKSRIYPLTLLDATEIQNVDPPPVSIFSATTGAIAFINMPVERSVHGGACRENCVAKACHMAKLWRLEWGQVFGEVFRTKAGCSWSLLKIWNPFFFELIAKLFEDTSCTQSKSLCVMIAIEQLTHWPASPASRSIDRDAERRLTSNDRHGVISCWIFANKPSSFRLLQYLCNSVFVFEIGHKLTSNEARKDDQVTIVRNRTMASKGVKGCSLDTSIRTSHQADCNPPMSCGWATAVNICQRGTLPWLQRLPYCNVTYLRVQICDCGLFFWVFVGLEPSRT